MVKEEALKTLKENLCSMCAYGSQCMESCDIRYCDNRDAIESLSAEPCEDGVWSLKDTTDTLKRHGLLQEQEPCKDTISRTWLKEAIHNFYYGLKHTPTEEDIQAYIDAAPPITMKQETVTEFADRCRECGAMLGRLNRK